MEVAALGIKIDSTAAVRAEGSLERLAKAGERAERSTDSLSRQSDATARAMRGMDNAARRSSVSMANLAQAAARAGVLLGAALSVRALQTYADSWSDMQSKVGAAVKNMQAAPSLMRRIVDIANASYSPLQQTVDIYTRNVAVLRELGKSSAEAADFTESLNHMLVITATKGQQAESVQQALSKAMAVGKLQADGLETVLANGGRVAEALAKALGTNVNGLRDMASQGKITSQVIAGALIGSLIEVRTEAEKMPATMGDAFGRAQNNLSELVGRLDQASGASSAIAERVLGFADGIRKAGDHLIAFGQYAAPVFDAVGSAVSAVASQADIAVVALAGFYAPAMLGGIALLTKSLAVGLVGAIRAVTAAMMANPIGLMVAALTASGYAAYKFRDDIQQSLGVDLVGTVKGVANFVIGAFAHSFENVKFIWNNLGDIVGAAMVGAVNVAIRALNKITSAATGAIDGLITLINRIPGIDQISSLGEVLKIDEMENTFAGRLAEAGKKWQEGFVSSIKTDYVGGALDWLRDKIAEAFDPKPIEDFIDAAGGGGGGGGAISKELKKWLDDMRIATASARTMTEAYLTGGDAISQLTRQVEIESKVLEHGAKARNAITDAITAQAIALDRLDIAKQIDGLRQQNTQGSAYLKVLAAQSQGYKTGVAALTAYNKQQALTELLVGKTADEVADLTEKFGLLWDQNQGLTQQTEGMQEINRLVESTRTKQEAYNYDLERLIALRPYAQTEEQARALERAIGDLQRENSVWYTFTEDAINRIDESFANMWKDWMDGSRSAFDAMKSGFKQMLAEMAHAAITRPIMISVGNAVMGTRTPGGISDVWGAARGANNLNSIFGAGYQALTGASAGASSASLGYANLVGAMGGDSIGALISANGGWEGALSGLSSAAGSAFASGITAVAPSVASSLGTTIGGTLAKTTASYALGGTAVTGGAAGAAGGAGLMGAIGTAMPYIGIGLAAASAFGLFDSGPPKTRHGQRTTIDYTGGAFGVSAFDDRQAAGSEQAALAAAQSAVSAANDLFARIGVNAGIESFYAVMESSVLGDRNGVASGGSLRIGDTLRQIGVKQSSDMTLAGFGGWSSAEMLPRLQTDIQLSILEAFQAAGDQLPSVLSSMLEGVYVRGLDGPAAQELAARFAAITEGALGFLKAAETMPFEQLRNMGFDAAAGMVAAAGGLENLTGNLNTYYEHFYTDQEKVAHATAQVGKAFGDLGYTMPDLSLGAESARLAFRGMVESLDLSTTEGQRMFAALTGLSGGFAQLITAFDELNGAAETTAGTVRTAADITRERLGLEGQLLQLQGNTAEIRRRELEALDESNHALQRQIWALQDQAEAAQKAADRSQAAAQAMSSAWSSLGASSGWASQYLGDTSGLQMQLSLMRKSFSGATDLAAREAALGKIIGLEQAIWQTGQQNRQAQVQAGQREAQALQQQLSSVNALLSAASRLKEYSQGLLSGADSGLSDAERLGVLAGEYQSLLGRARSGDADAMSRIQGLTGEYLSLAQQMSGSQAEYSVLSGRIAAELQATAVIQEASAQSQAWMLEAQIEATRLMSEGMAQQFEVSEATKSLIAQQLEDSAQQFEEQQKRLLRQIEQGDVSIGLLNGLPLELTGVLNTTLVPAISSIATAAMAAASMAASAAAAAHEAAEKAAGGAQSYTANALGGIKGIPGFADGGFHAGGLRFVGERGLELEATGPSRVYSNSQTTDILRNAMSGGQSQSALVAENRALQAKVERLEAQLVRVAAATEKLADQFDNLTMGGSEMLIRDVKTLEQESA
ncbi:tape measure protein [Alcaligenaceae bacterium]|nr:tape measure protein [Alcaligenaceae bacterium]